MATVFFAGASARADTSHLAANTTFSDGWCQASPGECTHETFENLDGRIGMDLGVSTFKPLGIAHTPSAGRPNSWGYSGIVFTHHLDAPVGYIVYTLRIRLDSVTLSGSAGHLCEGLQVCLESESNAYLDAHGESKHLSCGSCSSWGRTVQPGNPLITNEFRVFDSSNDLNLESQEVIVTLAQGNCDSNGLKQVPAGNLEVRSGFVGEVSIGRGEQGSLEFLAEGTVVGVSAETHSELPSDDIFCA